MTGVRRIARITTLHLHRRNGIFHLRVRVPDVVRLKLGMCEVHRSLKTYDKARARLLAAVLVPQVHEVFRMAATTTMDRVQLTALLHSHFEQLATEVDRGFVPESYQPDLEIAEQRELSVARINALRGQIAYNTYDAQVQSAAARLIGSDVSQLSDLLLTDRTDLCQGVARAEVEQLGILLHRLADRLPVLGLYTGARLGELVQLHLRDVVIDGPIPFIEISETVDSAGANQPHKHVKSEAGIRRIPLHPDVMALGLADFVNRRRKLKRSARLFWPIKLGADGQASTVFSKWFARLLDKLDLKDPALTFHSLRHGMQDALRDAKHPQYVIDRLFGHSSGTTANEYGIGASLEVLAEAVGAMKVKISLPALWAET